VEADCAPADAWSSNASVAAARHNALAAARMQVWTASGAGVSRAYVVDTARVRLPRHGDGSICPAAGAPPRIRRSGRRRAQPRHHDRRAGSRRRGRRSAPGRTAARRRRRPSADRARRARCPNCARAVVVRAPRPRLGPFGVVGPLDNDVLAGRFASVAAASAPREPTRRRHRRPRPGRRRADPARRTRPMRRDRAPRHQRSAHRPRPARGDRVRGGTRRCPPAPAPAASAPSPRSRSRCCPPRSANSSTSSRDRRHSHAGSPRRSSPPR
jgi:hypothetical protein